MELTNLAGAMNQDQLSFNAFLASRRGYVPPGGAVATVQAPTTNLVNYDPNFLDPRFPTEFAGVFKSSLHAGFAPSLRNHPAATFMENESNWLRRRPVNSGLLRGEDSVITQEGYTSGTPTTVPLFVRSSTETPTAMASPHANRNTNTNLRYQTLMRMPNLVADNSQVFLVRLTMGFFEVDALNTNSLGAEYNELSGEKQRYQAMFIIDRSIPVGFIPGQNLNARDTVIFERFYQ